ncbi:three-helix bundle dimerization domain-containing protein [Microbacterium sp. NPDC058389]|uniref:three-helix bundle dimerization domain-containing protein n=1 Tax=Microbacterium sp. NPDC058389 TaxID=3346475 RepID=UPI00365AA059
MSVTQPASEYEALVHVVDRLTRRFPAVDEATMLVLVAEQLERFDGARLRYYVPVLVEGAVSRTLHTSPSAA